MVQKREAYAPWSLTRKAGVQSATVNGDIEVPQFIQPVLNTGFVDDKGNWKGTKSSDEQFLIDATHEAVANGATVVSPQATPEYIDMTGFHFVFIALKPSNGGNIGIEAVMSGTSDSYANLNPVSGGTTLRGNEDFSSTLEDLMKDSSETCVVNVWNIFRIDRMAGQKLLQFKLTNSSGGVSNIDFAYMRVV